MNVHLTFDIEVWCNGWDGIDERFPAAFDRYIFGRSKYGAYALPKTLEILNRHGLTGVFFVESLFAARFGPEPLRTIVSLIRDAGQEVQLHLHPEWTDEALHPLIENGLIKRQHLTHYTLQEQALLIGHGRRLLEEAGSGPVRAFRSGGFAVNNETFLALRRNDLLIDSSLNRCAPISGPDLRADYQFDGPLSLHGVTVYPVTVFRDGFGQDRPAQVGAAGAAELQQALRSARRNGHEHFVIVSHNFEMLRAGTTMPDWVVVRRFEALCDFLATHRDQFEVKGFAEPMDGASLHPRPSPHTGVWPTLGRHVEQTRRRLRLA